MKTMVWVLLGQLMFSSLGYADENDDNAEIIDALAKKYNLTEKDGFENREKKYLLIEDVKTLIRCEENEGRMRQSNKDLLKLNENLIQANSQMAEHTVSGSNNVIWFVVGILAGGAATYFYVHR